MDYYAITIDTCIFENHGLSLEKGLLAQLEQFSASQFEFILSDVVYNELRKHLIDKNKSSRTSVNHAIKAASKYQSKNLLAFLSWSTFMMYSLI